jgi:hypothetical protein
METDMKDETELRDRLASIESRIPAFPAPELATARRHHFSLSVASAGLLVLAFAATVAGAVVVSGLTAGQAPGIENPGQPLEGARMECMTPPDAAAFLAAHGYTDVVWQIEAGLDKDGHSTTFASTPPAHGFVVPGAILDDGKLHMVIDQRPGTQTAGVCGAMSMP